MVISVPGEVKASAPNVLFLFTKKLKSIVGAASGRDSSIFAQPPRPVIPVAIPTIVPGLILASASAYRKALLDRLGVAFEQRSPEIDERRLPSESPLDLAQRLAVEKAQVIVASADEACVIGSDQVAAIDDIILPKPGNISRAREQLLQCSGSRVAFYTAVAVIDAESQNTWQHTDTTTVVFRTLDSDGIDRYLQREQPFDCAGSFKAESLGIALLERIESSDPTALIGLPLIWLADVLRKVGFEII